MRSLKKNILKDYLGAMPGRVMIKVNGDLRLARRERNVYEAIQKQRNWNRDSTRKRKRPHYCYKEGLAQMGVSATCRMCRVEREGGIKPVPSCARPVATGRKVWTETPRVQKVREGVRERRLTNHPLDCPICDQGGECDLQEQTWEYGSDSSRIRERKRGVEDVSRRGPVKIVITRCIHCTRCVRYGKHVAKRGRGMRGRGKASEIGRYRPTGSRQTPRAGNRVDRCPVGARTAEVGKFAVRPWESKRVESVDVRDGVGVSLALTFVGGERRRVSPKRGLVGALLGDKTRYGYDGRESNSSIDAGEMESPFQIPSLSRIKRESEYPVRTYDAYLATLEYAKFVVFVYPWCEPKELGEYVAKDLYLTEEGEECITIREKDCGDLIMENRSCFPILPRTGLEKGKHKNSIGRWVLGTALDRDRRAMVREEQRREGLQVDARGIGQRGALRRHSGERAHARPQRTSDKMRRTRGLRRGYERPLIRLRRSGSQCSVGNTATSTEGPVISIGLSRRCRTQVVARKGNQLLGGQSSSYIGVIRIGSGIWARQDGGGWLKRKGKRDHGVGRSRIAPSRRGVIQHSSNTQGRRALGVSA